MTHPNTRNVTQQILVHHSALAPHTKLSVPTLHEELSAACAKLDAFLVGKGHSAIFANQIDLNEMQEVHSGAFNAAIALDFSPLDAALLARAWTMQSLRLGAFDATLWPAHPEDFGMQTTERSDISLSSSPANHAPIESPSNPPYAEHTRRFPPCPSRLGLYAVLASAQWISLLASSGVPSLQLRFKSNNPLLTEREVESAVRTVEGLPCKLFINDHWQLAIKYGAYGVHLGQEDLELLSNEDWARMRASGIRLGISTHGYSEMIKANALQPSYVALGAIFPTTLKQMQTPAQGLGRLSQYARLMRAYPLVAIGGITQEQLTSVLSTGVGSVAVVRAITEDPSPETKATNLARLINQYHSTIT